MGPTPTASTIRQCRLRMLSTSPPKRSSFPPSCLVQADPQQQVLKMDEVPDSLRWRPKSVQAATLPDRRVHRPKLSPKRA